MWETVENGMRRPGEPVEEFAERAESEARLTDARKAGAEPSADPITQRTDAGITPQRAGDSQNASVDRLLNDVSTPEGQAYARAFSDTAAAHMKELRERDHLPEPDHTPGAPHPDPFLADRGWHVNEHGIYTRRPEPQAVIGRLVEVTADLDRVRARADGRLAADHARVWARGITVTDPGHAKTARRLRQEFRQPRTPAPAGDLIRDLADYDRAFGLVTTGDGEVAK